MQSTLLPNTCCNDIEKVIRKFIWGSTDQHRGVNLIRWSDLCQPLKNGGVGLLHLQSQNRAFISKLIYKLYSEPDALWVRVLKGKYGMAEIEESIIRKHSSHLWKALVQNWEDTFYNIKWKPGDGTKCKFWTDYWVGDYGPLKHVSYVDIQKSDLDTPISNLIDEDGHWKWHLFQDLLPPNILKDISKVRIANCQEDPSCFWNQTASGRFTTRSAYQVVESINWNVADNKWKKLWQLPVAQRVRTFSWLLLKERLLTNVERYKRGIAMDQRCSLCQGGIEDINHVFKHCPLASSVWKKILPTDICLDFFKNNVTSWLANLLRNSQLHMSWKIGIFVTCWKLWEVRNHRIFANEIFTVEGVLAQIRAVMDHTSKSFSTFRFLM